MDKLKEIVEVHKPETEYERFIWAVVGERGGVHVWAQRLPKESFEHTPGLWDYPFYGGVEVHRRTPAEYDSIEPSHDNCWLLDAPCWQDGSSLYFSDNMSPVLNNLGLESDGATFYALAEARSWYRSHFEGDME